MDDDYDKEEKDFAIRATSPNKGHENQKFVQLVNIDVQEIKEEDDEEIIVKEEFEVEEQYLTEELEPMVDFGHNEEGIDIRLLSTPIVYTTRLDDMRTFKEKYFQRTKINLLNNVLRESIPKYDNKKPVRKPYSSRSFEVLKQNINKFNNQAKMTISTINDETEYSLDSVLYEAKLSMKVYLRNQELMKMCKPCSVVLVKTDECNKIQITKYGKRQSKYSNYRRETFAFLIFHDTSNREVDVYCIKDGRIKENFTLRNIEHLGEYPPRILEYKHQGIKPKVVPCCCWQKRQLYIDTLDGKYYKNNIKDFMRKPHYCEFDKCTCCCRPSLEKEDAKNISPQDTEIRILDNEISTSLCGIKRHPVEYGYKSDWLDNLLNKTKDAENIVNRALNYTRPSQTSESKNKNISKQFETKSIMLIDSLDKAELIELQEEGDIVAYKKENYNPTIGHTMKKGIDELISCCWFKREQIIDNLKSKSVISPKPQRFLKLPHHCLPKKCLCCCKPKIKSSPLINIALPKEDTFYYRTKSCPATQHTKSIIDSRPVSGLSSSKTTVSSKNTSAFPKPAFVLQNMTAPSTTSVKLKKQSERDKNIQYVPVPTAGDTAQEIAVDSLITSILDRFKDVRLTINEDGKVAAALNAPVNTLTTSELKVLANILAHAQAQVKALGLKPGSLLNAKDIQGSPIRSQGITSEENTHQSVHTHTLDSPFNTTNVSLPIPQDKTQSNLHKYINMQIPTLLKSQTQQKYAPNLFKRFSNMSQNNNSSLIKSYTSFIRAQNKASLVSNEQNDSGKDINSDEGFAPKIANVFSLKGTENDISDNESLKSCALNAMSETQLSESVAKRKADTDDSQPQPASKIRVVDPAKLGIPRSSPANFDFIGTQLQPIQPMTLPSGLLVLPSPGMPVCEIFQSLPGLDSAQLVRMPSTVANNPNNIFVVGSGTSCNNVVMSPTHTNNARLIIPSTQATTPLNMNAIVQSIASSHGGRKPSTVFTISNLDKATVAEPRLLNADPVKRPRKNTMKKSQNLKTKTK